MACHAATLARRWTPTASGRNAPPEPPHLRNGGRGNRPASAASTTVFTRRGPVPARLAESPGRRLATMAANPLSATERTQVEQAKTDDLTGLYARDKRRNWIQL
jgi:hypothetical protein